MLVVTLRIQPVVDFGGDRLGGAGGAVEFFGGCEIAVTEHDLECLGGDAGVDQRALARSFSRVANHPAVDRREVEAVGGGGEAVVDG